MEWNDEFYLFFPTLDADREKKKNNGGRWIHGNRLEVSRKGKGFPGGPLVKNPPSNAEDRG